DVSTLKVKRIWGDVAPAPNSKPPGDSPVSAPSHMTTFLISLRKSHLLREELSRLQTEDGSVKHLYLPEWKKKIKEKRFKREGYETQTRISTNAMQNKKLLKSLSPGRCHPHWWWAKMSFKNKTNAGPHF
ncbi:hypothetical protein P7K49_004436, partial [Saguinus oedipus]